MKQVIVFLLLVLMAGYTWSVESRDSLFPKRDEMARQSRVFFKQVNLTFPPIGNVEFFVRSEAFPTAYLNLTHHLIKSPYFVELLTAFEKKNFQAIEKWIPEKTGLDIRTYPQFQQRLNTGNSLFYLLLLYTLYNDYNTNNLSGEDAYILWNVMLCMTQDIYKKGEKTLENATVLEISSHLVFFKQYKKWEKRAVKIRSRVKH